jgi:hypothetical protein
LGEYGLKRFNTYQIQFEIFLNALDAGFIYLTWDKGKSFTRKLGEVILGFLIIVVNGLNLGKNLSSLKLVNFVGKVISGLIFLKGQLELSNYFFINNNLQSYITYRSLFCGKSVFNLFYSKLRVFLDKFLNLIDSLYNLTNL